MGDLCWDGGIIWNAQLDDQIQTRVLFARRGGSIVITYKTVLVILILKWKVKTVSREVTEEDQQR